MLRTILTYGAIAGLIAGGGLSAVIIAFNHQSLPYGLNMAIGYLIMLVALSMIFVAVKRRREELGGVIRFWPALGMGLGISLVAAIFYALAWEVALTQIGIDHFIDSMIEQYAHSPAEIARMRGEFASYHDPLVRLPLTMCEILPVGVLVSLVAAALLRNPRFLPARSGA